MYIRMLFYFYSLPYIWLWFTEDIDDIKRHRLFKVHNAAKTSLMQTIKYILNLFGYMQYKHLFEIVKFCLFYFKITVSIVVQSDMLIWSLWNIYHCMIFQENYFYVIYMLVML